jgi:protein subunit release factor A
METIILEIRPSNGGEDAKLLVDDMKNIYTKAAMNNNFKIKSITEKVGLTTLYL